METLSWWLLTKIFAMGFGTGIIFSFALLAIPLIVEKAKTQKKREHTHRT